MIVLTNLCRGSDFCSPTQNKGYPIIQMMNLFCSCSKNDGEILNCSVQIISDSDESSAEEMISDGDSATSSYSEHDQVYVFKPMKSKFDTLQYQSLLINDQPKNLVKVMLEREGIENETVKNKPPWHVEDDGTFIVDLSTFECRNDVTVDAWTWVCTSTYVSSSKTQEGPFHKGDQQNEYRLVKRYYRCKQSSDLEKTIICLYEPKKTATDRAQPFRHCVDNAIIRYRFINGPTLIQPAEKTRTYQSVKDKISKKLKEGIPPKKARYITEEEVGGLDGAKNKSFLPKQKQAYNIARTTRNKTKVADPLRELMKKQHNEKDKKSQFIRKIQTNEHSYDIILFNNRQIENIANFCCTDLQDFKSSLDFDFTFELGTKPSYYVLVTTYKNTSLYVKGSQVSPTMLGPVMICHKKDERVVKMMCDAMKEVVPGLENSVKVIGMDGEKSLINMTCKSFPNSLLLVCVRHEEDNCRRSMPPMTEEKKKDIIEDIFGSNQRKGLIDCLSFKEYDQKLNELYDKWVSMHGDPGIQFKGYFEKHKKDQIKYHVMKGAVLAAELQGNPEKFYSNCPESMNRLIKLWQKKQKLDMYEFSKSIEELTAAQENDVQRAFLGLDGPYTVRAEFQERCKDYSMEYVMISPTKKSSFKQGFLNAVVDKPSYRQTMSYKAGRDAVKIVRQNLRTRLDPTQDESEILSDESTYLVDDAGLIEEFSHSQQPLLEECHYSPDAKEPDFEETLGPRSDIVLFLLKESLPSTDSDMLFSSIQRAKKHLADNNVIKGFSPGEYLVRSISKPRGPPHLVRIDDCCRIICDNNCIGFLQNGFCGHAIATAIHAKCLERYARSLSHLSEVSYTKIASRNIDNSSVGRKKPLRKKVKAQKSPEKRLSLPLKVKAKVIEQNIPGIIKAAMGKSCPPNDSQSGGQTKALLPYDVPVAPTPVAPTSFDIETIGNQAQVGVNTTQLEAETAPVISDVHNIQQTFATCLPDHHQTPTSVTHATKGRHRDQPQQPPTSVTHTATGGHRDQLQQPPTSVKHVATGGHQDQPQQRPTSLMHAAKVSQRDQPQQPLTTVIHTAIGGYQNQQQRMQPSIFQPFSLPRPAAYLISGPLTGIPEGLVVLTKLNVCRKNVSKCYGCDNFLLEAGQNMEMQELVLTLKIKRKYRKDGEIRESGKPCNTYYHINFNRRNTWQCICSKFQWFNPNMIHIDCRCIQLLTENQKVYILHYCGLQHLSSLLQ